MRLSDVADLFRCRRFWVWEICGAAIYAVPAVIRLATGNVLLPVLSWFAVPWVGHFIPGNLVEKILVNAFFPGGAGAVAGEIYYTNTHAAVSRRQKYIARLEGAMVQTALWSLFQFVGYLQNITGSYGGNLFEYPGVYPLNFALAALSVFTPTVLGFLKDKIGNGIRRLKRGSKS